jgi:hypothetical protein
MKSHYVRALKSLIVVHICVNETAEALAVRVGRCSSSSGFAPSIRAKMKRGNVQ